jgi:hypothetical protein
MVGIRLSGQEPTHYRNFPTGWIPCGPNGEHCKPLAPGEELCPIGHAQKPRKIPSGFILTIPEGYRDQFVPVQSVPVGSGITVTTEEISVCTKCGVHYSPVPPAGRVGE